MQGKNPKKPDTTFRRLASTPRYVSPNQLILEGFETPFDQKLCKNNRWIKLSNQIPWDKIVSQYDSQFSSKEGRPAISGRVVIGALIIKHIALFIQQRNYFTNRRKYVYALFLRLK